MHIFKYNTIITIHIVLLTPLLHHNKKHLRPDIHVSIISTYQSSSRVHLIRPLIRIS